MTGEKERGLRPRAKLVALLLGIAVLLGVQAIAAAPAGALLSEGICTTDMDSAQQCDGESAGGTSASGDSTDTSGDSANTSESTQDGDSQSTSSFDPSNDGIDPNPFEDPLAPRTDDPDYSVSPTKAKLFPMTYCNNLVSNLSSAEDRLDEDRAALQNPGQFSWSSAQLKVMGKARATETLRNYMSWDRKLMRHFRALYASQDCDSLYLSSP